MLVGSMSALNMNVFRKDDGNRNCQRPLEFCEGTVGLESYCVGDICVCACVNIKVFIKLTISFLFFGTWNQ